MLNVTGEAGTQQMYRLHPKVILRDDGDYLGGRRLLAVNKGVAGAIFGVDEVGKSILDFLRVPRTREECVRRYSVVTTELNTPNAHLSDMSNSEYSCELEMFLQDLLKAKILVSGEEALQATGVHPGWTHSRTFPDATKTPASFPMELELNVTARCNLRCRHCVVSADARGFDDELTTEEIFRVMDEADSEGLTTLRLTGGEPFVRSDFLDVLDHATDRRFNTVLLSNLALVDESIADRLGKLVLKVGGPLKLGLGTSIDGADAATHDAFRGMRGAFDRTVRAIRLLAERNVRPTVQVCLHRRNLHQIKVIADLLYSLGAPVMFFYFPTLFGRATSKYDRISLEEMSAAFDELDAMMELYPDSIMVYDAHRVVLPSRRQTSDWAAMVSVDDSTLSLQLPPETCAAGIYQMAIDADGGVYPCSYCTHGVEPPIGSVRESSLGDIWSSQKWLKYRGGWTLSDLRACRNCKDLDRCQTWKCRGLPAADTGDFFGPPRECRESICGDAT